MKNVCKFFWTYIPFLKSNGNKEHDHIWLCVIKNDTILEIKCRQCFFRKYQIMNTCALLLCKHFSVHFISLCPFSPCPPVMGTSLNNGFQQVTFFKFLAVRYQIAPVWLHVCFSITSQHWMHEQITRVHFKIERIEIKLCPKKFSNSVQ